MKTEDLENFSVSLVDALDKFDRDLAPRGLYASFDVGQGQLLHPLQVDWQRCLSPRLRDMGWHLDYHDLKIGRFDLARGGDTFALRVVKLSKIKVRRYGARYAIDSSRDFTRPWQDARLDRAISRLWRPERSEDYQNPAIRALLFIGFDKRENPFSRELADLRKQVDWESHGVLHISRQWADRHGRAFFVRVDWWAYAAPKTLEETDTKVV